MKTRRQILKLLGLGLTIPTIPTIAKSEHETDPPTNPQDKEIAAYPCHGCDGENPPDTCHACPSCGHRACDPEACHYCQNTFEATSITIIRPGIRITKTMEKDIENCARCQTKALNGDPWYYGRGSDDKKENALYWQSRALHHAKRIEEDAAALGLTTTWPGIYPEFHR